MPHKIAEFVIVPVLSLEHIEASTISWRSPSYQRRNLPDTSRNRMALRCFMDSEPAPILEVAAKACW